MMLVVVEVASYPGPSLVVSSFLAEDVVSVVWFGRLETVSLVSRWIVRALLIGSSFFRYFGHFSLFLRLLLRSRKSWDSCLSFVSFLMF